MKRLLLLLLSFTIFGIAKAQVGIGTFSPAGSAILDLTSSDKGFLPPRMTATNRIALPSPVAGLVVFDTDSATLFIYQQPGGWRKILPVSNLGSIIAGTAAGDVLVWNGTAWVVTPKNNLYNFYFRDQDGDGKGDRFQPLMSGVPIYGFVADSLDCDDNNALVGLTKQYRDADGDGAGDNNVFLFYCTPQAGYVFNNFDCDDTNASINPSNPDIPDDSFIDANCDGIDGREASAIFVSPLGNDANAGTKALPVKTIGAGILKAAAGGKTQVLVAAGVYNETVVMQAGISIYGGYSTTWVRSAAPANAATINGQAGTIFCGINASVSNITIDRFTITAPNATGATAGIANSSYGIYSSSISTAEIKNCRITAGTGAPGITGAAGTIGAVGSNGSLGGAGSCDNSSGGGGGAGGASTCGRGGGNGGNGGYGGGGNWGADGTGGTFGGFGGNSGNPAGSGGPGTDGTTGANGPAGAGAIITIGAPVNFLWSGATGSIGGAAIGGNGGGGGGGGGGQVGGVFTQNGRGNGGSGGGAGGCPGGSGAGGVAGGGSIGIFLAAHGTGVTFKNNIITTGNGGAGGTGGISAVGGAGGTGAGSVSFCTSEIGSGAAGGAGGTGGIGAGGGGGAGGISYGIYTSTSGVTYAGNTFTLGTPGAGGAGGAAATGGNSGTAGAAGASGTTYP